MSFLDALKDSALNVLTTTVNALHAQFANTLIQAGHDVSTDAHVDTLMQTALSAAQSTGKPQGAGAAPNYADHALATFSQGMGQAMSVFAHAFLPAKFQPIADAAASVVDTGKVTASDIVSTVVTAAETLAPAPIAAVVGTVASVAESVLEGAPVDAAPSSTEPAAAPTEVPVSPIPSNP